MKEILEKAIAEELRNLGLRGPKFDLDHPTDRSRGDYATNAALVYAKKLKRSPIELASDLVQNLKEKNIPNLEKITVAGFGFINFYLKDSFFSQAIGEIITDDKFGQTKQFKGQKVMIEYTDANTFKIFHIGHLMSNTIGESMTRLFLWNGAEIKRANYQGDVGLHIAKAIYGLEQNKIRFIIQKLFGTTKSRVTFLGEVYAEGAKAYEADKEAVKAIKKINKKIYDQSSYIINLFYKIGRDWSLSYLETIYERLGTKFDFYFFESETSLLGKQIVEEQLQKKVFAVSDGAVIYKGEVDGLHTRVFLNSEGLPTYEAKDLGLIRKKIDSYKFNRSISITGNEQTEYFKVILKVAEKIFPEFKGKLEHLGHGFLVLPSGKMSSRTGDVVPAENLLNQLADRVLTKMSDRELSKREKKTVAKQVSVAALKFSILKQSPGRDVVFDFDKSISFEGDSGPYLQYTAVRAGSVLAKAKSLDLKPEAIRPVDLLEAGINLEHLVYEWPEVVARAGKELSPQLVVSYLLEVPSAFNSFYAVQKIIDSDNQSVGYHLALVLATRRVLVNGLNVLGCEVPEKM